MASELRGPCDEAFEDDRLGRYVAAEMAEVERDAFEIHVLECAACRAALEACLDLADVLRTGTAVPIPAAGSHAVDVSVQPARYRAERRLFPPALAAAVVIGVVFGMLAVLVTRREDRRSRQASARPAMVPSPAVGATKPTPPAAAQPDDVRVLELPRRAAAPVAVAVTTRTRGLRVEVAVDADSLSFDASVQARHGGEVWRAEGIPAPRAGKPLVLELPARILALRELLLFVQGEALREGEPQMQEYALRVSYVDAGEAASANPR